MKLAPQQITAIDKIRYWLEYGTELVFRLFGYAGTGKTTLAKYIAEHCTRPIFCAFTGKAAHVLRQKGCEAFTIHQLIYNPQEKSRKKLQDLEVELAQTIDPAKKEQIEEKIRLEHERLKSPNFILNEDSVIKDADLVIVDECSMVSEKMAHDLMSFGVSILVLGDPAQLPPTRGSGYFINGAPDFMLTEIHRQAADNPIIQLATSIRQRNYPVPDGGMVICWNDVTPENALNAEQIIVGRNDTRTGINARMRNLLGRKGAMPEKTDRLVCLRNNHDIGLLNGAIWNVENALPAKHGLVDMALRSEDHQCIAVTSHTFYFLEEECKMSWWQRKEAEEFDYGYALTCHKSQGSEWDKVLVFDESSAFGANKWKHLYTAVTRAAKELILVVRID